jgi:FtsZ-interacting cell division protein YlmF
MADLLYSYCINIFYRQQEMERRQEAERRQRERETKRQEEERERERQREREDERQREIERARRRADLSSFAIMGNNAADLCRNCKGGGCGRCSIC